jgi:LacI family transcriptional regulator
MNYDFKDLAKHLGVSVGTISRVLAGRGDAARISKATQERIQTAAEKMGVQPNELARSLRTKKTRTIGLLVPDIANPFFASIAHYVEQRARSAGYSVLITESQELVEKEGEAGRLLFNRRVDGLIVAPVGDESSHLEELRLKGLPIVQVDRVFQSLQITAVVTDNFNAARQAVRHLIERGHRQIACLQGKAGGSVNQERVRGYLAALAEAGVPFKEKWLIGGSHSLESGHFEVTKMLNQKSRPTALLAISNMLALGTLKAARDLNLQIPTDLALVSFDDHPWTVLLSPSLTTMAQSVEDIGTLAFNELLAAIQATKPPSVKTIVLPAHLIVRESS